MSDYNEQEKKKAENTGEVVSHDNEHEPGTEKPKPFIEQLKEHGDAVMGWGRGGEIEIAAGRSDVPTLPIGTGISGSATLQQPAPSDFGAPVRPDPFCGEGVMTLHNGGIDATPIRGNRG